MTTLPKGTRNSVDEPLFGQPSDDRSIIPDTVTAAVEGYFRIPAVWIGEKPDDATVRKLDSSVHHEVILEKDLCSGIKVRVQRDGTFLFDFSSWEHAPQIMIPGYRTPGPGIPHRQPTETADATIKSEKYAVLRAQVMNVHQACVATSERILKHRSSLIGLPLTSDDVLRGLTFDQCLFYRDSTNARSLARNALNNRYEGSRKDPFPRHVLEAEIIHDSLDRLDHILLTEDPALIQMSEAAYLAGCRCAEGRSGEAITLAWSVCEQVISTIWKRFLTESSPKGRMPRNRLDRLTGGAYTASVMTEFLELEGRIENDVYQHIEEARKGRNNWVHDMKEPDNSQVNHSIQAVEGLLQNVHGIRLSLSLSSPSPGVPAWNKWAWEACKSN